MVQETFSPTSPIIVVKNVTKRYLRTTETLSLRHEALSILRRVLKRALLPPRPHLYALKNISFSVDQGESIGIVGRNGSGKTTLLRVLAGITRPTDGKVKIEGKFTALIGLGAGFLPNLSGRKNIYLNAAMHGIAPGKTSTLFDSIVEFSELQDYLETPVKHYSSGMAARLAFSIAVHILSDIIFLDEVLAVGDSAFQEKCFARIQQLKAEKRTILFVSHDPIAVNNLCERTIWLNSGELVMDGATDQVLDHYRSAFLTRETA
jgi:lipopolysaccharide transport system ATP-binding protein